MKVWSVGPGGRDRFSKKIKKKMPMNPAGAQGPIQIHCTTGHHRLRLLISKKNRFGTLVRKTNKKSVIQIK